MAVVAFVTFSVAAEDRDRFVAAAKAVMAASRTEAGCMVYAYGADLADASAFHITEVWESQEALDAHLASPHAQTAMSVLGKIAEFTSIQCWSGDLAPVPVALPG